MQHQSSGHEDAEGHRGLNGASGTGHFWDLATRQPFVLKVLIWRKDKYQVPHGNWKIKHVKLFIQPAQSLKPDPWGNMTLECKSPSCLAAALFKFLPSPIKSAFWHVALLKERMNCSKVNPWLSTPWLAFFKQPIRFKEGQWEALISRWSLLSTFLSTAKVPSFKNLLFAGGKKKKKKITSWWVPLNLNGHF